MSLPKTWTDGVDSWCEFSADRLYRYSLTRRLADDKQKLMVCIGLNPSTADELIDDRTVRRLAELAHRDGLGTFTMLNLFAYRATDPRDMLRQADPIGVRNVMTLFLFARPADRIVLCWGNHGSHLGRSAQVLEMLRPYADKLYCFGVTKSGEPRHPVRMAKNTPLVKWEYPT